MSDSGAPVSIRNHLVCDPFTETGANKWSWSLLAVGTTAKLSWAFPIGANRTMPAVAANDTKIDLWIFPTFWQKRTNLCKTEFGLLSVVSTERRMMTSIGCAQILPNRCPIDHCIILP